MGRQAPFDSPAHIMFFDEPPRLMAVEAGSSTDSVCRNYSIESWMYNSYLLESLEGAGIGMYNTRPSIHRRISMKAETVIVEDRAIGEEVHSASL